MSPEKLDLEAVREYELYLRNERKLPPERINTFVTGVKFLGDSLNLGFQNLPHKLRGADSGDLLIHRIKRGGFAFLYLAVLAALQQVMS